MARSILPEDLTESAGRRASAEPTPGQPFINPAIAIKTVCTDCGAHIVTMPGFTRCDACTDTLAQADPAAETEEQLAERRSYRSLRDTPAGQAAALALQAYRETQASRPAARAGIICRTPRQRRMFAKSNAQAQEGN